MRIESALYSSREGLNAHGQAISVVGDNISNSNTVGYKSSRVEFSDLLAEGGDGRASSAEPVGGNGVAVTQVRQLHETGVVEFTGRSLDVAIAGNGFFVVGDPSSPNYTRAGNFSVDENGLLINSGGKHVLGYAEGTTTLSTIDVQNLDLTGEATTEASVIGNLRTGEDLSDAVPTNPATYQEVNQYATFTSSITVYDNLGVSHDVTLAYFKTDTNTFTVQAYMNGEDVGAEEGAPIQIGQNATLNFATDGMIAEANAAAAMITATPAYSNGADAGNFVIDLSGYTQFGGSTVVSSINQNGEGAGNIKDYEFRADGGLYALLDSGASVLVANVPLASFPNVDGLQRSGNALFSPSDKAGTPTLGLSGTGNLGTTQGASLERSTVDVASEFVELVVYQRGYQASSQTLNAANELIKNTISLVR